MALSGDLSGNRVVSDAPVETSVISGPLSVKELLERRVFDVVRIEDFVSHLTIKSGFLTSDLIVTFGEDSDYILAGNKVNRLFGEDRNIRAWIHAYSEKKIGATIQPLSERTYLLHKLSFPQDDGSAMCFNFYTF